MTKIFLLIFVLLSGCGIEDDITLTKTEKELTDVTGPSVVLIYPAAGERDVPVETAIVVRFSEPVDTSTISALSFSLTAPTGQVSGTYIFSQNYTEVIMLPSEPLLSKTEYSIMINFRIQDRSGNALVDQDPNDKIQYTPFISKFITGD